ncbi:MAG: hypothetical protein A07HR60_00560 [uncultured archaeon A07HR60]|nr:MAG: hypothetical protein J07HR59_00908 [Halorubrum sp. J07HR59]ESS12460.1 MAG: hypothetical protein A07HR60_00560 [uncultured archaeon A07HR60]
MYVATSTKGVSDDRGPAHCPQCAVVEPAGGFERDDPIGTERITRFRCLDCRATFAWRCFPDEPECTHGPFRWAGERFVFYFGQGTRPETTRAPTPDRSPDEPAPDAPRVRYRADLDIASYDALDEFMNATSDALVDDSEAASIKSRLESAGGDVEWPCEIVFEFHRDDWAEYSSAHPDEATVLESHLVSLAD